jgi:hypothetical protein
VEIVVKSTMGVMMKATTMAQTEMGTGMDMEMAVKQVVKALAVTPVVVGYGAEVGVGRGRVGDDCWRWKRWIDREHFRSLYWTGLTDVHASLDGPIRSQGHGMPCQKWEDTQQPQKKRAQEE